MRSPSEATARFPEHAGADGGHSWAQASLLSPGALQDCCLLGGRVHLVAIGDEKSGEQERVCVCGQFLCVKVILLSVLDSAKVRQSLEVAQASVPDQNH